MLTNLRICGKDYKIRYIKQPMIGKRKQQATIHHPNQTICVKKGWNKDWTAEALLHEALHGIESSLGLDMNHELIHLLSPALQELFRNNPKFLEMFR